jgi:uncharacterized protein YciI
VSTDRPVRSSDGGADRRCRFAYFYLMKPDPERIRAIAPRHAAYWQQLRLDHYVVGGPFADRTGGLITFEADVSEAERAVRPDPSSSNGSSKRIG